MVLTLRDVLHDISCYGTEAHSMGTHDADRSTLTVEEAAARLGISRTLAYELARAGRLPVPVLRLGRRVVVSRMALDRVLAAEVINHGEQGDVSA
jgi:excisionase family DNA binding protein